MLQNNHTQEHVQAALLAAEEANATPIEKAEMLMDIAMSVQQKPQKADDLFAAINLYQTGLEICPENETLVDARIRSRMATALMAVPGTSTEYLEKAQSELERAVSVLTQLGSSEELAEAKMNLGLVFQNLAIYNKAPIKDAISAYQHALRIFDKSKYPKEFAILQNNLATAFLSIPFKEQNEKMCESLAVQAFEEGLSVVNLVDYPTEYAMLQNNLGNALQYISSSHHVENGFRAIEAYNEALKIRTAHNMPGEYANTIANKANCLANLPNDINNPEASNTENINIALGLYREALGIFTDMGTTDKIYAVEGAIKDLEELALSSNV